MSFTIYYLVNVLVRTVTDVKKRPKVGQAALPIDKVGATY